MTTELTQDAPADSQPRPAFMDQAEVKQEGPILTDQGGNLPEPIRMCAYGSARCKHLGVHDWHYFYCAAQDAANQHAGPRDHAYPWRGAGKQLMDCKPDSGCPFVTPNALGGW